MGELYYLDAYRPASPALIRQRAERLRHQVESDEAEVLDALRGLAQTIGGDPTIHAAWALTLGLRRRQLRNSAEACRQAAARGGRP